jgi:NADPH-dependent curcumin reductase CurA
MTETAERIVLVSRPVGEPTLDNFRLEALAIPKPGPSQMLLRTLWLSLDPYMRGRMSDAPSYAKPVGIGDVMEGGTSARWLPHCLQVVEVNVCFHRTISKAFRPCSDHNTHCKLL